MNHKDLMRELAKSISHNLPFADLPTPLNDDLLDNAFFQKWVQPFYMKSPGSNEFRDAFQAVRSELTDDIIKLLFGEFNWRMRSVAALFAALQSRPEFVETIGNLMLKSEVCYAGRSYALALAFFGDSRCADYLERYLSHYLTRKDLWFDQSEVLSALMCIDRKMGTTRHKAFIVPWDDFVSDKPNWNLREISERFEEDLKEVMALSGR